MSVTSPPLGTQACWHTDRQTHRHTVLHTATVWGQQVLDLRMQYCTTVTLYHCIMVYTRLCTELCTAPPAWDLQWHGLVDVLHVQQLSYLSEISMVMFMYAVQLQLIQWYSYTVLHMRSRTCWHNCMTAQLYNCIMVYTRTELYTELYIHVLQAMLTSDPEYIQYQCASRQYPLDEHVPTMTCSYQYTVIQSSIHHDAVAQYTLAKYTISCTVAVYSTVCLSVCLSVCQ